MRNVDTLGVRCSPTFFDHPCEAERRIPDVSAPVLVAHCLPRLTQLVSSSMLLSSLKGNIRAVQRRWCVATV